MDGWIFPAKINSPQINISSLLNVASPIKPEEFNKKSIIDFTWNQTSYARELLPKTGRTNMFN
jgi:hypothetical protein